MLAFWLLLGAGIIFIFALIYLLSLTPPNTICPKCKKKKSSQDRGWKIPCEKCEGDEDD